MSLFPGNMYFKFLNPDYLNKPTLDDTPPPKLRVNDYEPFNPYDTQSTNKVNDYEPFDPYVTPPPQQDAWRTQGPISDMPIDMSDPNGPYGQSGEPDTSKMSFLDRQLYNIHKMGLDSPENLLISSLGGGLEVGGKAIARSSIPYLTKLLKLGEGSIGAGMVGTGLYQAATDPEQRGSGLVNALFGGMALHGAMRKSPVSIRPEAPAKPKFSEFGNFTEPTSQPRIPGLEDVNFNQARDPIQMPLADIPSEGPQYQQPDIPFGPRSWGRVPEPTYNAEGQYNLFQGNDAAQSYEGVPRQSPFEFGRPPTMEDMAPRTPKSAEPPPTASVPFMITAQMRAKLTELGLDDAKINSLTPQQANDILNTAPSAAPTGTSDIQGVVFQGDNAVLTQPSDVNMALLKQRGYEPSGKLQNGWPVWNKAVDLSESAFTKAMRASIERQQSEPAPEGMGGQAVGPTDPIIVPAKFANQDKFLELADQGYEVGAKLPNGDVQMNPIGGRAYSDPFGVGTVVEAVKRLGRSEAPKTEVKGGMMSDPFGIGVIGRALRGMRELHNPPDATTGGGLAQRVTRAEVDATTHVKDMDVLSTRLGEQHTRDLTSNNLAAAGETNLLRVALRQRYDTMRADGTLQRGPRGVPPTTTPTPTPTIGQRLNAAAQPRPKSVIISSNTPTTSVSSRYLDPDTVAQRINSLTNVSEAHQLADEYSRLHGVADRLADKTEANDIKALYDQTLKKRDELLHADALGRGERPVSEVMDEFAQQNMSAKNRQRFERKKAKPLSAVATEMKNVPGMERIATTVDPTSVMHYLSHEYARRELSAIPNGAPGFELVTNVTPRRLGGYGDYRAIYRNPQGKPIVKVDFNIEHGIGKIGSMGYDKDSGLVGRALLKTFKEITPMGVRMPSGSISRHTLNFMDKMGRMVNTTHGGFINLAELFSKNPDNNKPLLNYVKEFFTRQRADGKTVIDKEKLAAALKGEDGGVPKKPLLISNKNQPSVAREAYNFARGMTTTMDLSAPLRQGLPLIASKKFWTSLKQMTQSLGDEVAFEKTLSDLRKRPLFQRQWNPETGKLTKSFAEVAGIKLQDLHEGLQGREEAVASNWAESGGMLGSDLPFVNRETSLQRGYQKSVGRVTRASNRAYTAFLNQLRADSFESLLKDAHADFKAGTKGSKDPYADLTYAKEIADYVNTATGRGPLRFTTPGVEGGRFGQGGHLVWKDRSLERLAPTLADIFFSPRLMASRMRMLNPGTYMMATPFVRKQYLKSLFSVAGFAGTMAGLAAGAGADVSLDPNSSDFMKIRIGNTRLDMMGGFQQFVVAASRLLTGHDTSSASGKDFETGQGYRPVTRGTIAQNFMTNKLHPIMKFANDMAYASQHQPFAVGDRTLQLFVPLIIGDVMDLAKEDPRLLPLAIPTLFGAGTQTYDKGAPGSKFLPPNLEPWNFTGGGLYR